MSILTDYQISFGIQKIHGRDYKFMKSNEFILSNLISEFSTMRKSDELVEGIKYAQDHPQEGSIRCTTDGLQFIEIFPLVTKIYTDIDDYHDQNSIPNLTLPTNDFKEIALAWKNFVNNGNT
ncbi:organic solvent tolerance protein [Chryseobacterium sp. StRB126]|uniref:hypothetical protein n=1 Tax=Chryseobacterium sp. StRB126 TaxID=878220 RepID=UPI0004E995A3|nr:hypothetical protein [Chryseobacterium sp. StRB126]BAP32838.1 organic solvent tolerance protein [Chryseobacterium sp. StRB126]